MKHVKTFEQYSINDVQMNEIFGFSKVEKIVKLIKNEGKGVDLSKFSDADIDEVIKSEIWVGQSRIEKLLFNSFLKDEDRLVKEKLLIEAILMKLETHLEISLTYNTGTKKYGLKTTKLKGVDSALKSPNPAS
jgi:hypothetical protein